MSEIDDQHDPVLYRGTDLNMQPSDDIPGFTGAVNTDTPPSTYTFRWDDDPCSPRYVFNWFNDPPLAWNQGPVTSSNTNGE